MLSTLPRKSRAWAGRRNANWSVDRLIVLLQHLLKWQFQEERRGSSWEATILVQRYALERHLDDNPSLKSAIPGAIERAYRDTIIEAAAETGLPRQSFPVSVPWTFNQILDEDFWPEQA